MNFKSDNIGPVSAEIIQAVIDSNKDNQPFTAFNTKRQNMSNIIDTYKKLLGLEECKFYQIKHDDALVAIVYKIETADNQPLILKICERQSDYLREVHFLRQFNGILPIANIINTVAPSSKIYGAILMECVPGELLKPSDLTESLAYEIGSWLAHIHLKRTTKYGDVTNHDSLGADPIKYFTLKFDEGFEECKDNLPSTTLNMCRKYYDTHINLLKNIDGPCVIHRDFRPGNIIVKDNKVQAIIDWASARSGFAEDDFCPIELGEWPMNTIHKDAFLAGYASIRQVPNYTALMPLLRLNRALATIGFTVKRGIWDNTNAKLYQTNRDFIDDFFNLNG